MRIEAIETIIPDDRIEVTDILRAAGASRDEEQAFTTLFRMRTVAAADARIGAKGYFDLLMDRIGAAPGLPASTALFHAHSLPMRPGQMLDDAPDLSRRFATLRRLEHVYDVDQFNCAGMFYALSAAERMLEAGLIGEALVFGGDCLSDWSVADRYVPGCTVLGDAYVVMRLSARSGGLQIGPIATRLHMGYAGGLDGGAEEMARFNRAHMDIIADALSRAGHDPSRDEIFPHNINGLCWRLFSCSAGQPAQRIHDGLVRDVGHCCNTDPFLSLARAAHERMVQGTVMSVGMAGFSGSAPVTGRVAAAGMAA